MDWHKIDPPHSECLRNHVYYTYRRSMAPTFGWTAVESCVRAYVKARFPDPVGADARALALAEVSYFLAPWASQRTVGGRLAKAGVIPRQMDPRLERAGITSAYAHEHAANLPAHKDYERLQDE